MLVLLLHNIYPAATPDIFSLTAVLLIIYHGLFPSIYTAEVFNTELLKRLLQNFRGIHIIAFAQGDKDDAQDHSRSTYQALRRRPFVKQSY